MTSMTSISPSISSKPESPADESVFAYFTSSFGIKAVQNDVVLPFFLRDVSQESESALYCSMYCRIREPLPSCLVVFATPALQKSDTVALPSRVELIATLFHSSYTEPISTHVLNMDFPFATIVDLGQNVTQTPKSDCTENKLSPIPYKLLFQGTIHYNDPLSHLGPLIEKDQSGLCASQLNSPPPTQLAMMPVVTETPTQKCWDVGDVVFSQTRTKRARGRPRKHRISDLNEKKDESAVPAKRRGSLSDNLENEQPPKSSKSQSFKGELISQSSISNPPVIDRENPLPTPRWGHTLCSVDDDKIVLFGGQGPEQLSRDVMWTFDGGKWTEFTETVPAARMGHSCVYSSENHCLYLFGGAKYRRFFRDVHCYDIRKGKWSSIKVQGGKAPLLSYHSCVLFHNQLMVFGGNFPNPDPIPDGCSAELHCFDIDKRLWFKPILVGDLPPARSGHSATVINGTLVIFGGWDAPVCYNDVYQLDLTLMEVTKLDVVGDLPPPRTWHIAFPTVFKQHDALFIQGGYNGDEALNDAYVLDLLTREWVKLSDGYMDVPCAGHAAATYEEGMFVFGGGNNEGNFYNHCVRWPLPKPPY